MAFKVLGGSIFRKQTHIFIGRQEDLTRLLEKPPEDPFLRVRGIIIQEAHVPVFSRYEWTKLELLNCTLEADVLKDMAKYSTITAIAISNCTLLNPLKSLFRLIYRSNIAKSLIVLNLREVNLGLSLVNLAAAVQANCSVLEKLKITFYESDYGKNFVIFLEKMKQASCHLSLFNISAEDRCFLARYLKRLNEINFEGQLTLSEVMKADSLVSDKTFFAEVEKNESIQRISGKMSQELRQSHMRFVGLKRNPIYFIDSFLVDGGFYLFNFSFMQE